MLIMNLICTVLLTLSAFTLSTANANPTAFTTADGQTLKGDLMMPATAAKAAVLILQGSGNVGMDGDVSGAFLGMPLPGQSGKLSFQIAESLAKQGIASLRFNKRGVDHAEQLPNQKLPFLVDDAKSALEHLKQQLPGLRYGVIGFSEGGILASLLANDVALDGLFLMAAPTRHIDAMLGYQFYAWPTKHLLGHLGVMNTPVINASVVTANQTLSIPLVGSPLNSLDLNQDGQISVYDEVLPFYQGFYQQIRGLLATPQFAGWYESFKNLRRFSEIATGIQSKQIFFYQGTKDAQISTSWIMEDAYAFPVKPTIRLYHGLGHCFSPMSGEYGEIKTAGPLNSSMLSDLTKDVSGLLN
jgi:hypothetical protein